MRNGKISEVSPKERDMAVLSKSYLVFYNSVQTAGWSYILFQTVQYLLKHKSAVGLWKTQGIPIVVFQTLAAFEVLHSILRIVHANPALTFFQVASRIIHLWGIVLPVEKIHNSPTLALTILAWSITEIVRYSYYCSQLLGKPSKFHTWCRYSLFFLLYPAGVTGEVSSMLLSLDTIKKKQFYSILLPNPLNISLSHYYIAILILLAYIPIFPQLFYHMVRQRKKVLSDAPKKEA